MSLYSTKNEQRAENSNPFHSSSGNSLDETTGKRCDIAKFITRIGNFVGSKISELAGHHCEYQQIFEADLIDHMKATLYGQCIGDAIGLLTEFMTKEDVEMIYGKYERLEYNLKHKDRHRCRWKNGDWTDDSDQMILIMQSLTEQKGEVYPLLFAKKLFKWIDYGFSELGDKGGCGIGRLTYDVTKHSQFQRDPFTAAKYSWEKAGRNIAPNGGVMRTSIMGLHEFWDVDKVKKNAVEMCKVTHYDERCQASVVAVSVAISLMLQNIKERQYNIENIIAEAYAHACEFLRDENQKEELKYYMFCKELTELKLSEQHSIGYTFKCVGAGFWALKQTDFRKALEQIVRNGGDADTNSAVAGALLGCKLGMKVLPYSWTNMLLHKVWLDDKINRYLDVLAKMYSQRKKETLIN